MRNNNSFINAINNQNIGTPQTLETTDRLVSPVSVNPNEFEMVHESDISGCAHQNRAPQIVPSVQNTSRVSQYNSSQFSIAPQSVSRGYNNFLAQPPQPPSNYNAQFRSLQPPASPSMQQHTISSSGMSPSSQYYQQGSSAPPVRNSSFSTITSATIGGQTQPVWPAVQKEEQKKIPVKDMLKMLEQDEDEDEDEFDRQIRERREKIRLETERVQREEALKEEEHRTRMEESKKTFQEERESLSLKRKEDDLVLQKERREKAAQLDIEFLKTLQERELNNEKNRQAFQEEIISQNERIADKNREHLETMRQKHEEMLHDRVLYEETLRKLQDAFERKKTESARMWEEKMKRMNEQFEQIQEMFKYRIWNEIIERNWTNRLNVLRTANNPVASNFISFRSAATFLGSLLKSPEYGEAIQRHISIIVPHVSAVLDAIGSETVFLEKELTNLQEMLNQTGKSFLQTIIVSILNVTGACEDLKYCLDKFQDYLQESVPTCEHYQTILSNIFEKSETLRKSSASIPTLAELKKQFQEEMHEQKDNRNRDVVPVFQSVLIEEIE